MSEITNKRRHKPSNNKLEELKLRLKIRLTPSGQMTASPRGTVGA